jgi:subtilase family serine protease
VVITPNIGSVDAGGSRMLSTSSDKTYVLTAINSGGTSSMSINVKAVPPEIDKGDIVIIDVFRETSMVYYKIKNNGSGISKACSAVLYVGPTRLAADYIAPLKPGEERTETFGTFSWSYRVDTPVTLCIDSESENGSSNKMNNCLIKLLPAVRTI